MPQKRPGLFLLVLPAIVFVALGGAAAYLLSSSWFLADAQSALFARLNDTARAVGRGLDDAARRQGTTADLLSRSPAVALWMRDAGERSTSSTVSHETQALQETARYGQILPGATILMASDKTRMLYRDGAPDRALSRDAPQDAWYFTALTAPGADVESDSRTVQTSAPVRDVDRVVGAVAVVSQASDIAQGLFASAPLPPEMRFALTDSSGQIVAQMQGDPGASTIFDLYPSADRRELARTMVSLFKSAEVSTFTSGAGDHAIATSALRTVTPGWYLFISARAPARLPISRILLLVGLPLTTLALLLLLFIPIATAGMKRTAIAVRLLEDERDSARDASALLEQAAREASAAAADIASLSGQLASEAAAAEASCAEADAAFKAAEERDTEFRAGVAGRLGILEQLHDTVIGTISAGAAAQAGADAVGQGVLTAEGEITRAITSAASVPSAIERAAKASEAVAQAAQRMRMVAMNLALEAARGGAPMQGFLGIADELRGLADDAAARAGALSSALADMGSGVQEAARAAEGAGAAIHEAAQAAGKISRAASSIGKGLEPLAAQAERAGASAARVHDLGASSDLGRSALAGVARVVGRIVTLTGEMTSTARGESKATAAGQPAAAEPRITAAADKN